MIQTPAYANALQGPAELYGRLNEGVEEFKLELGDVALDIGDPYGAYVPVIRAMGVGRVALISPNGEAVSAAVRKRIILPEDANPYCLEEYLFRNGPSMADSAFAFNVDSNEARSLHFVHTLGCLVRPEGIVVATMMNGMTSIDFNTTAARAGELQFLGMMEPLPPYDDGEAHTGPNACMQFWQRSLDVS